MTTSHESQTPRQDVPPVLPPGKFTAEQIEAFSAAAAAYLNRLVNEEIVAQRPDLELLISSLGRIATPAKTFASLNARTGSACYLLGFPMLGLEPAFASLRMARVAGDSEQELKSLSTLSLIHQCTGDWIAAEDAQQAALRIAEALCRRDLQVALLGNLAITAYEMGVFARAEGYAQQALELGRGMGERAAAMAGVGVAHYALGQVLLARRQLGEARERATKALACHSTLAERPGKKMITGAVHQLASFIEIRAGDLSAATKHLAWMRECFAPNNDSPVRQVEAMLCVAQGDADVGLARLKDLLDQARLSKMHLYDVLTCLVWTCEIAGKRELLEVYQREIATMRSRYSRGKAAATRSNSQQSRYEHDDKL